MRSAIAQFFVLLLIPLSLSAQDVVSLDKGAVGTYLKLGQLRHPSSVLHVVAHPDDEDGAFLTYCARHLGARTMLFSITRGEGGANLISDHFFDELGVLRTLEHLKAAEYYGNRLFYSRAADYGYSKTLEEAKGQWDDGIPVLRDLVEVIRRQQPTVIVSRFRGDPRDGHGHHQMAGVLARRAFDAAADPQQFPEMLEQGLQTWQAKKLFVGLGFRANPSQDDPTLVRLPTGTYDPMLGRSYTQIARFGLGFQRSQGISGHETAPGPRASVYRLAKIDRGTQSQRDTAEADSTPAALFDPSDLSYRGGLSEGEVEKLPTLDALFQTVDQQIASIWTNWQARAPESSVGALTQLLQRIRGFDSVVLDSIDQPRQQDLRNQLSRLQSQLQDAILASLGIQFDVEAKRVSGGELEFAVVDSTIRVNMRVANQNPTLPIAVLDLRVTDEIDTSDKSKLDPGNTNRTQVMVDPGESYEQSIDHQIAANGLTTPPWSRQSMRQPLYQVRSDWQQQPLPQAPLVARAILQIGKTRIDCSETVTTEFRDPVYGQVEYPLSVVPAISVRMETAETVVPNTAKRHPVHVTVRSLLDEPVEASVRLDVPSGWNCEPKMIPISFRRGGEEKIVSFDLTPTDGGRHQIQAIVSAIGREFKEGFVTVTAPDLGRLNLYRPATQTVRMTDVSVAGQPTVGYIDGSGDDVAESLSVFSIDPQILSSSDLATGDLSRFDLILIGVRAYAVRDDLRRQNQRLMEYVQRGGVLIVQYQTPEFDNNYGPYPYEMGRRPEEVSEEDAKVTILEPNHVLFDQPNQITEDDFEGWVEQRGSKFLASWDDRYLPLLESHDTNQQEQRGGMLITRYGKGVYVYSAYAWYRQLPAGVPGAYRLFANLLSLPETKDQQ